MECKSEVFLPIDCGYGKVEGICMNDQGLFQLGNVTTFGCLRNLQPASL